MVHHKRESIDILADILRAARELGDARAGKIAPSGVVAKAMLPYDRGAKYLEQARKSSLLDGSHRITEKGQSYLAQYAKLMSFLEGGGPRHR